ncbi:TetR/AcrR family transcriptional regulator [Phenylobacterium soli]|uniref:TetR/AcrR family transcriptional regulator n=1 Tax=Phenylobacterium soli TaxID=2170551 RepID=A0A328AC78_9CAUL|nr:TetR/AcrR family transcriptional regulator [Phenylobacterium soli]RAK51796.1 TetR/AcrR family transcriptional regulator [Phenylobacterium soli]
MDDAKTMASAGAQRPPGEADADRVRTNILEIATEEFAAKGLTGARIDEIAERTLTSKRMIYYHFGGKEGLYRAVLAHCYGRIRTIESTLDLGGRPPLEALAHLVRFTFDYQVANEDFIRLVMVENIHRAEYVSQMPELQALNLKVIELLRGICERGAAEGVIRPDVDPTDLHMSISALCFFNVANRHTFSVIHEVDMMSIAAKTARRETIVEMVLRYVRPAAA